MRILVIYKCFRNLIVFFFSFFQLSVIKESSEIATVEKKTENACDYLFDILSHNTSRNSNESDSCPPVEKFRKRSSTENKKKQETEELNKVSSSPVRTKYMTRSHSLKLKGKLHLPKESQKNLKIIPKEPRSNVQTTTKKISDEFKSPHPLSNTINMDSAKSPEKKASNSGKKNVASKKVSPPKLSQVKKTEIQKASQNKKQSSGKRKSEKPSVTKKQTRENPKHESSKKTVKKEKKKELGRKMIKDWTDEEVQKLLT